MKIASVFAGLVVALVADSMLPGADEPTAQNGFTVDLSPPAAATALLADSPFGINTAFNPAPSTLRFRSFNAASKPGRIIRSIIRQK